MSKLTTLDALCLLREGHQVALAHGCFDIVHPGHLRHLRYAKERADVLVVSITADEHITKGDLRPWVPQALRAQNLAALEMVDYVIIDPNPTPIETIRRLKPDLFAKGYEYQAADSSLTAAEKAALDEYGGQMLFTPGDVVYSSSALLQTPPNLAVDRALSLLASEGLTPDGLRAQLQSSEGVRVHVIGDLIVDAWSDCALLGASPKVPMFSVRREKTQRFVGGAGIVAKHLKAAGAEVTLTTVCGQDDLTEFVLRDLRQAGVTFNAIWDHTRPTTQKERIVTAGHPMIQLDTVDNRPIGDMALQKLLTMVGMTRTDVVVFSDFRHGMFSRDSIPSLTSAIPDGAMTVADSQVSNRWGNILDFQGFDLITPNEKEARFALGDQDSVVRSLATRLYDRAKCRNLILKLGDRGLVAFRGAGRKPREFFALESFCERLVDPVGAGDALLAYATLGLKATKDLVPAALLGALAASVACETAGNVPVTPDAVERKLGRLCPP